MKGRSDSGSGDVLSLYESRKRTFGTDVSNICFKRNKADSSTDGDRNQNLKMQTQIKDENTVTVADSSNLGQDSQNSGSFHFGPFAPVKAAKADDTEEKVIHIYDWESLSSTFRPQYHNQGIIQSFSCNSQIM